MRVVQPDESCNFPSLAESTTLHRRRTKHGAYLRIIGFHSGSQSAPRTLRQPRPMRDGRRSRLDPTTGLRTRRVPRGSATASIWRPSVPAGRTCSIAAGPKASSRSSTSDDRVRGFRGNKQFISTGNLSTDDRVALILVDYPHQARLKILGRVEVVRSPRPPRIGGARSIGYKAVGRTGLRDSRRGLRLELPAAHHAALHGRTDSRGRVEAH